MTNEELAARAKDGDDAALLALWDQTQRMAWKFMGRWIWAAERAGMETADCEQVAFVSLLRAVKNYEPNKNVRFSTIFVRSLQTEFAAASGTRTEKQNRDPLRYAVSLDLPASPDAPEDLTLGDLIEDPQAEEPFRQVDRFGDLEPYLATLPKNQQAALYRRFWLEVDADTKALNAALRTLRHPSNSRQLKKLLYS